MPKPLTTSDYGTISRFSIPSVQIQEIRTYYEFASVDNDRYVVDGEYRQTMVSTRELNSENLPNQSWINEHLQYTHGFGVALGPRKPSYARRTAGVVYSRSSTNITY
ncbi:MAG: UPF0182 family protein [Vicinamibacterales bacterium]